VIRNKVAEMRADAGLTQTELARRLQVTRQTIISLEKNRYMPSLEMGFKVAEAFGKRIEEVFEHIAKAGEMSRGVIAGL
jgi:putative transcriptional regulator